MSNTYIPAPFDIEIKHEAYLTANHQRCTYEDYSVIVRKGQMVKDYIITNIYVDNKSEESHYRQGYKYYLTYSYLII